MAVEVVLGLLVISLASLLLQVETFFKKEIFAVFIAGVWTLLPGFGFLCGGRKPSYCCMRLNMFSHLATVILLAVAFGTMVRHVPYQQHRYCKTVSCGHVNHETMVLVGGILAILITIFLVETLLSLAAILTGLYSMFFDYPEQPEDPECVGSTTPEALCPPHRTRRHLETTA